MVRYERKQPAEQYAFGYDFVDELPTGVDVSSAVLSAIDLESGTDQTATILLSSTATIVGTQVLGRWRAGIAGRRYKIRVLATLSNGDIFEEDVILAVIEE
jgi:hypothetical protein